MVEINLVKRGKKKKILCWVYGISGGLVAIGGGTLMVFGGPLGLAAGGVILGAALSNEVGTI